MLAAMRLLNIKQEFLRKRKFPKGSNKSPVSFNILQETFNTQSGLKNQAESSFIVKFIKATFHSSIKLHNRAFPGGWINSSRRGNNVKTDFALLNILGWTEKVPSHHKLCETVFNTVDTTKEGKSSIVNLTQAKRDFSFQEFRTAVALTLPRFDTSASQAFDEQIKLDPLSVKDLAICNNFVRPGFPDLVDSLNECYALRVSQKNPQSKTKEIHYKISRDRMIGLSANLPLIDAKGRSFSTFSSLPVSTQKLMREKYRYPLKKRQREEEPGSIQATPIDKMVVETSSLNVTGKESQKDDRPSEPTRKKRLGRSNATKK
jgi:hypothetical protein